MRRARPRIVPSGSRGSVTAETAVALPALLTLVVLLVAALASVGQLVRCRDAASAVARAVARGESLADVDALARATAPGGARVVLRHDDQSVSVDVTWEAPTGIGRLLPEVHASSTAWVES